MQDKRCEGCNKLVEVEPHVFECKTYPNPAAIWRRGGCALCSTTERVKEEKKKVNPLKENKRTSKRGKKK